MGEKKSGVDLATKRVAVIPKMMIFPFIMVTSLFALWGFANDITNPMVQAFKDVLQLEDWQSYLVQAFFYGGYALMAIPAAFFIRRFSYKSGILVGLVLYATGALLFLPAAKTQHYAFFLLAFMVITFGLSFLETTSNPYILSMGSEKTATRRLNLAQAFNPMGSFTGMMVATFAILNMLNVSSMRETLKSILNTDNPDIIEPRLAGDLSILNSAGGDLSAGMAAKVDAVEKTYSSLVPDTISNVDINSIRTHDLSVIMWPYLILGIVVCVVLVLFAVAKLPNTAKHESSMTIGETFRKILHSRYILGVVAQFFYVAAQIMCWTTIIQYGIRTVGLSAGQAQLYNMVAMGIFILSRFICTFLLKYVSPGHLLKYLALVAMGLTLVVIFFPGMVGLVALVTISACMSLMFPTIYGIALDGMGEEAKLASAGLIFSISGGSLLTFLQGWIVGLKGADGQYLKLFNRIPSVALSFVIVFICFAAIAGYGYLTHKKFNPPSEKIK